MMFRVDVLFLRSAVLWAVAGMALGIFMAMSGDHAQMPTHAHINLVGWLSMAMYAVVYRLWPAAGTAPAARWHFILANAGAVLLTLGVGGIMAGGAVRTFEPLAAAGALATVGGMLLFAHAVWRRTEAVTFAIARPLQRVQMTSGTL